MEKKANIQETLLNNDSQQLEDEAALRRRITISALKAAFALTTIILSAIKLIFPVLAYDLREVSHFSGSQIGILFLVFSITEAIGALIIAPLGDKFGFDKLMFAMYPGIVIGYTVCALFPHNYFIFMGGFAVTGFFSDGYGIANAYVSIVALSPDDVPRYCGFIESAFGICSAVGPIAAAQLYNYNIKAPLRTCVGVAFLCGLVILCTFYGDQKTLLNAKKEFNAKYNSTSEDDEHSSKTSINMDNDDNNDNDVANHEYEQQDTNAVSRNQLTKKTCVSIGCLCVMEFFKTGSFSIYGAFMIMYMIDNTNDTMTISAVQLTAGNVFMVFGSMSSNYLLTRRNYKPKILLIVLMIYLVGVIVIILWFVEEFYWIMYIMSPQIGFAIGLFNVCISISISKAVPSNIIGLVSGFRLFLLDLGFGSGPLVAAVLYEESPNNIWFVQIAAYSCTFVVTIIYYVLV